MIAVTVLFGMGLIAIIIMQGVTLHEVEEVEDATCPYSESSGCWDGNACHAPLKKLICPIVEGTASRSATTACTAANYVCENPVYPDGTCCNANDFCFLPDPNKTCQQGQCVSADPTLCKGYCLVDEDCTSSSWAFPIYESAATTTFCLNGACFAYVYAFNAISPNDLLNRTTLAARNISACLETSCFISNVPDMGDVQICQFAWLCSQLNGFSDQTGGKKRAILDSARAQQDDNETDVPILHNFTLPGGGRYTRGQYNEANKAMNAKLLAFVNSWRN